MNSSRSTGAISARLDRLPFTSIHRTAFIALGFIYFFELGDLNTFAYAAPPLIKHWGISVETVALITSASFGGMFLGAVFGGVLGDRVGRKRGLIYSVLLYGGFSLLNALAWDVASLAIARFVTGVGLSSMTVIGNAYIAEFFPSDRRGRYMGLVMTVGLIGIPATAWVSRFVVPVAPWGWRLIFVWGSLGILALVLFGKIPESPRWLQDHGRSADAEAELAELEQAATAESGPLPPPALATGLSPQGRSGYGGLFQERYLGRTIILLVVNMTGAVAFYGFFAWVPTLLLHHGFTVIKSLTYTSVIALSNPLGTLIAADLMERIERKWFNVGVSLFVAASGVAFGYSSSPAAIMILGAMVVVGLQAAAAGGYIYTSEIYSTDLRAQGVGLTYGAGRLANVGGAFVIAAVFAGWGYAAVFGFIALCQIARAFAYAFGPAATGRPLEELSPSLALVALRAERPLEAESGALEG